MILSARITPKTEAMIRDDVSSGMHSFPPHVVALLLIEIDALRAYIERVRDAEFHSGGDITIVMRVLQEDP